MSWAPGIEILRGGHIMPAKKKAAKKKKKK